MANKAFAGRSSSLERGDGASPEVFTKILQMKKISPTGSKADLVDVTNMDSGVYHEFLPTLLDSGEIAFEGQFVADDTSQANLLADFHGQVLHNWKIVLPGSPPLGHWDFEAYVVSADFDIEVAKEVTMTGKLKITRAFNYTSGS
jgi:predicted secreted protein